MMLMLVYKGAERHPLGHLSTGVRHEADRLHSIHRRYSSPRGLLRRRFRDLGC
jgi:hypothetical protein